MPSLATHTATEEFRRKRSRTQPIDSTYCLLQPKSYEFGYSVKDAQSGNDYDRRESSDGNVVRGEYRVQLPDGRTQIVTYHADWQTGFHADVRYEGEARYPEPVRQAQSNQGGYNYPSDFSGSLTGFQGSGGRPSTAYGPPGFH
ncbi:hypothetical protein MSG28_015779 [Choristoneura fumiferana]|uniref:Uncharacterized protein n=1 Tax=Choristoneura fumiferana TaxID=7141 RepID=A0ACC0KC90_CHOFU|nr:hypothetical protein MSG28_015779 [Choristoneura fumiferana]